MTLTTEDKILRGPKGSVPLPEGLARYVFSKMQQHGGKVAQVYPELGGLQLTYAQLCRRSALTAAHLRRLGLRPGDVLGVATAGGPHFTPLLVGSLLAGVVFAPFNPDFDQDEMRHLLGVLRPRAVVADKPNALYEQRAATVLSSADVSQWFEGAGEGEESDAGVAEPQVEQPALDAPAVLLCSSGTTGYPKAVQVSHRGLLHLLAMGTEKKMMMLGEGGFLLLSPVFWISPVGLLLLSINAGGRIVAMARFQEALFLKVLREQKVVGALMPPFLGVRLLRMNPEPDLTPLRHIVFTGSAMDRSTQSQLQDRFKLVATQMYGMTELLMTLSSERARPSPLGSVGLPQPNVEVKVVDTESGDPLGPGQDGELCFRAPTVTPGYYNDPAATAAAIDADGWFHTGDIGHYDDAGYFYITDRIKDLIKYKGHHVSSALLEGLLYKQPAVLEAAVVGVPDPLEVELPRAYVALRPGAQQVSAEQLAGLVNAEVSDHQKLRGGVVFMEKLPRTATGKVCKKILRELAKKEAN